MVSSVMVHYVLLLNDYLEVVLAEKKLRVCIATHQSCDWQSFQSNLRKTNRSTRLRQLEALAQYVHCTKILVS